MKDKISSIIAVVLLLGLCGCAVFFGARTVLRRSDAVNPKDGWKIAEEKGSWITGKAVGATDEVYLVKHTMCYVIPTAKEHYYFAELTDASGNPYLVTIRADKSWYRKNFDENGYAKNEDGVTVTGYVRTISGKFRTDIQRQASGWGVSQFVPTVYVDLLAFRHGIFLIIIGAFPLLLALVIFIFSRIGSLENGFNSTPGKVFFSVFLVVFLAYLGLLVHTVAML